MTTVEMQARSRRVNAHRIEDYVQFGILGVIVIAALAGAFTHMHDWTIAAIDETLKAMGSSKRTPDWIGWANAVISELLPTSSVLAFRKRQRQKRSTKVPVMLFVGSAAVSLLAQLSATGIKIPLAAQFLACLPAIAVMILGKVILSDVEFSARERERIADLERAEAEQRAELDRAEAERQAELSAELARREAELAAEQERQAAELSAELARRDAELSAELARQQREHEAELEERRLRIEADAATERARIEAADRAAEREARERREAREAEIQRTAAVEAAKVRAEAEADAKRREAEARTRLAEAEAQARLAEAQAKRAAAAKLATVAAPRPAAEVGGNDDEVTGQRRRRPRAETATLVDAVLATLPTGTTRDAAVNTVAVRLNVTPRYAREFVPEDWPAGSSAGGDVRTASSSAGGDVRTASSSAGGDVRTAASSADGPLSDDTGSAVGDTSSVPGRRLALVSSGR